MGKGLPRSTSRGAAARQEIVRQDIRISKNVTVDGASGVGFGTVVIGDFPAGNILLLGAVSYIALDGPASGATATFEGDYSIGTVATADANVSDSGEADIIPSTAIGPAVSTVTPSARGASTTSLNGAILDNTDGSLELNLNVLIDDASISADDVVFAVTGTLHLAYIVLGDD